MEDPSGRDPNITELPDHSAVDKDDGVWSREDLIVLVSGLFAIAFVMFVTSLVWTYYRKHPDKVRQMRQRSEVSETYKPSEQVALDGRSKTENMV